MNSLVDVVNFNADASSLSAREWLRILSGGENSSFCQWLRIFIRLDRKVVIGFPGATVADIAMFNPEAIALVNNHPCIFEIILRPFAHDIALMRVGKGFEFNLSIGWKVLQREFRKLTLFFLPPEFMLTNAQVKQLKDLGVTGVFINPLRFSTEIKTRISPAPYQVKGLFDTILNCIPFTGNLTNHYLHAIQRFECQDWINSIAQSPENPAFSWRDGESPFLIPDGLLREEFWLAAEEKSGVQRRHIQEVPLNFQSTDALSETNLKSYPIHSFLPWMKEFRNLGFLERIRNFEISLEQTTSLQKFLWLMTINSDILSATEKRSPLVLLRDFPVESKTRKFRILRSERGFEGEEFLALLELTKMNKPLPDCFQKGDAPHRIRFRNRLAYLETHFSDSTTASDSVNF
ncbi:MAG: hypothetical protein WA705_13620 [Candidatus Ozemobacteraceae bacterium]